MLSVPATSPPLRRLVHCRASPAPTLTLELNTAEARATVQLAEARPASGECHVLVAAVAPASEAERLGLRAGYRVVGVSDPVRATVVWELSRNCAVRTVRDALRLRVAESVTLVVVPSLEPRCLVPGDDEAGALAAQLRRRRLPIVEERGSALPTLAERRNKKREARLEEVGRRDDTGFFLRLAAGVLATPLLILALAGQQGWLTP